MHNFFRNYWTLKKEIVAEILKHLIRRRGPLSQKPDCGDVFLQPASGDVRIVESADLEKHGTLLLGIAFLLDEVDVRVDRQLERSHIFSIVAPAKV